MPSGIKKVFITPLTDNSSTDKEGVGTIRFEGNKVYKYVKVLNISATVAGAVGDMVSYGLALMASSTVVTDSTDSQAKPVGAGMLLAAVAGVPGTAEYVWVQTKGPATALSIAGTAADGDALYVAAGSDKVLTLATAADDPVCAYADDDSAFLIALDCVF